MIYLKASFLKRVCAFFVDSLILSVIIGVITMGFSNNTSEISSKLLELSNNYSSGEVTDEEFINEYSELNYELQKSGIITNVVNLVMYVGYFVIFGYLNKGQTLGKKLFKIKVANKEGDVPSIWNMLVRSLFIYGIITLLYCVILINIIDKMSFLIGFLIVYYIEAIFIMIAFFMVLYKKDGRGLHDMIAGTNVIEEVK